MNTPSDCMNFMPYASYRHILRKWSNFGPKIKILFALSIKNWGFQLKMARGRPHNEKMHKN